MKVMGGKITINLQELHQNTERRNTCYRKRARCAL